MASVGTYLFLVVICVSTGNTSSFVEVNCKSENLGQYGHQSTLECRVNPTQVAAGAKIRVVTWKKDGSNEALVMYSKGKTTPSTRFQFAEPSWTAENMNVSLLITDTKIADAGRYKFMVMTDRGDGAASVSLTVTAKYDAPTVHSLPEKDIPPNTIVTLFCNASGGYPEGRLRWFDKDKGEWTRSSELQVKRMDDGRFNLFSKLTLLPGSVFSQYTCSVHNATGGKEEEHMFTVPLKEGEMTGLTRPLSDVSSRIVAPVVVIGSLIVGLLMWLLISRRRSAQARRCSTTPLMSYQDVIHTDGGDLEEGDQKAGQCCQDTKI